MRLGDRSLVSHLVGGVELLVLSSAVGRPLDGDGVSSVYQAIKDCAGGEMITEVVGPAFPGDVGGEQCALGVIVSGLDDLVEQPGV